jgi:hypothetical protein
MKVSARKTGSFTGLTGVAITCQVLPWPSEHLRFPSFTTVSTQTYYTNGIFFWIVHIFGQARRFPTAAEVTIETIADARRSQIAMKVPHYRW